MQCTIVAAKFQAVGHQTGLMGVLNAATRSLVLGRPWHLPDGSQSQWSDEAGALLAICRRMELLLLNVVRGMQGC